MSAPYFWDEALPEVISEVDWSVVTDWGAVSAALDEHVSTAHEFLPPTPSGESIYALNHERETEGLRAEAVRLTAEVDAYRASVARRHNVPLDDVYLDHGEVIYGKAFS